MKKSVITIIAVAMFALVGGAKNACADNNTQIFVQLGHSEFVTSVALSPDGKYVLSGSDDKTLKLWETATGKEIRTFAGHANEVKSVAFSPDGKYALSGSHDDTLKLWDVATGKEIRTFTGHSSHVTSVVFSKDGKYALSGSWENNLKLWDVATGKEVRTFTGHAEPVTSVAFSPDGKYALSGSWDKTLKLWDVATGKEIRTFTGHGGWVDSVVFSPGGKYALSGSEDKTLKIWEIATGKEIRAFNGYSYGVETVVMSPDERYLLSKSYGEIKLWDFKNNKEVEIDDFKATGRPAIFSSDGRFILSGDYNRAKLWEIATGKEIRTFTGSSHAIYSVAFSPDGRSALLGRDVPNLWDIVTGKKISSFVPTDTDDPGYAYSVAFSPDGRNALAGYMYGVLKLWDVATGKEIRTFIGHIKDKGVSSVAFSPNGKYALSGSKDKTIKLWDVAAGKATRTFTGHAGDVNSVAFSPDGKYALSGSDDKTLKLWDIATGKEIRTFTGHANMIFTVVFSFDGKYALSGSSDHAIKLWDVATGKEIRTFAGHASWVQSVVFSSDGKYALSGSKDQTLKIWDIATGKEIRTFAGHAGSVNSVNFLPDGKRCISGSEDGTSRIWDLSTGKEIAQMVGFEEDEWLTMTPDGHFNASAKAAKNINVRIGNNVYSIDNFFDNFFNPGYVTAVLGGQKVEAVADIRKGIALPPEVAIISPSAGDTAKTETIQVTVRAKDAGGGVEDIRLYQNGKRIGDDQRAVARKKEVDKGITKTFEIQLVPGANKIRATAYSTGRVEANPYEMTILYSGAEKAATLHIVAIGINKYKNEKLSLNFARPDAESTVALIKEKGKGLFKEIKVTTIYDEKATKPAFIAVLDKVAAEAKPEDVFVFFYAGHGTVVADNFYFVPTENTRLYAEEMVKENAVSDSLFKEKLGSIKALKQVMIVDACQSGTLTEKFAVRGAAEEKALAQLSRSTGTYVLAATQQEQYAGEFKELGHGVFTYVLLKGLGGGSSPKDGKVTIKELTKYLDDQVPELTKKYKGQAQYPNTFSIGQDFPIAIVK